MASDKPVSIFRKYSQPQDPLILEDSHGPADVDNYHLLESVGVGAYAKVYKAQVLSTGALIAAKIVNKAAAPADYVKKFLPREIEVLQTIEHPNCVQTYEIFSVGQKIHMIMELAPNGDVLDYINSRGRINEATAHKIFSQLVSALEYFYSKNIAHRDLKCENLLLDEAYDIKVSDFGFATAYEDGQKLNTFCGSVAYACPEILYGQPYDGRYSDLWSISVVLYALVCGQLPFQEGDMKRMLMQLNSPLVLPGRLSSDCADLLRKALATDLSRRATLADVMRHKWLKPITPKTKKPINIPERRSPVVKRNEPSSDLAPPEAPPQRKRSATIDASELVKTKILEGLDITSSEESPPTVRTNPVSSSPSRSGTMSPRRLRQSAANIMASLGEAALRSTSRQPAAQPDTAMECDPAPEARSRAMTGSAAPSELARQMSWRKRIRQNISQYMSMTPDSSAKKPKEPMRPTSITE